jgi:hypothetical protein
VLWFPRISGEVGLRRDAFVRHTSSIGTPGVATRLARPSPPGCPAARGHGASGGARRVGIASVKLQGYGGDPLLSERGGGPVLATPVQGEISQLPKPAGVMSIQPRDRSIWLDMLSLCPYPSYSPGEVGGILLKCTEGGMLKPSQVVPIAPMGRRLVKKFSMRGRSADIRRKCCRHHRFSLHCAV